MIDGEKMGATGGRENISSRVHTLVKFIPFIMHLNNFPHVMGAIGGRENMSNHVHRLVKFIPFIIHLNDFLHVMLF